MWRLLYSVPLWAVYSAVALVLWIVGAAIIPVMAWRQWWELRPSFAYADRRPVMCWRSRLVDRVWGNAEDGVTGAEWYRALHADWPARRCAVFWSAFRNPTNNMRFWPLANPRIEPRSIHYLGAFDAEQQARDTGAFAWTLTRQGVFSGLRLIVPVRGELYRIWWGWKLRPSDRNGIDRNDYRFPRCGFATQLKRI